MSDLNSFLKTSADYVVDRFKTFGRIPDVTVQSIKGETLSRHTNCRSEILLYGPEITLRLQFFFSSTGMKKPLAPLYDSVTEGQVSDFFNELGNLSLGKMKDVMAKHSVFVALSLPVTVATSAARILEAREVLGTSSYFEVVHDDTPLFQGKLSCEIHKPEVINKLKDASFKDDSTEGEIEFF